MILGGPDSSGFNSGGVPIAGNADRPDVTRSGPLPQDNRNPDVAFDRTYFRPALTGRVGASGRNQYYGPNVQNYDLALAKSFPLVAKLEGTRAYSFARIFSISSTTNFANPVRDNE